MVRSLDGVVKGGWIVGVMDRIVKREKGDVGVKKKKKESKSVGSGLVYIGVRLLRGMCAKISSLLLQNALLY
jgi:hypothetical protein